uniref:Uncharacterized protein n=1 Tax=Caenorhabditis tropicalis TaxID=1561998 RepID=A0A1I7TM17_9PELO
MYTKFLIILFLATSSDAGVAPPIFTLAENSKSCSSFDTDNELKAISSVCLTEKEREQLASGVFKISWKSWRNFLLIREAHEAIGIEELRSALGFSPVKNWTHFHFATESEIEAAETFEKYYELIEPLTENRSLDSEWFYEENVNSGIEFLDKRFPAIRIFYRCRFSEALRETNGKRDRETVDRMRDEFEKVIPIADKALYKTFDAIRCHLIKLKQIKGS